MSHTIFNHEIDAVLAAANILFSPDTSMKMKMDDRTAFQTIHHIMTGVKERTY